MCTPCNAQLCIKILIHTKVNVEDKMLGPITKTQRKERSPYILMSFYLSQQLSCNTQNGSVPTMASKELNGEETKCILKQ